MYILNPSPFSSFKQNDILQLCFHLSVDESVMVILGSHNKEQDIKVQGQNCPRICI